MKYPANIQKLVDTFFGENPNHGHTTVTLRQAIEAKAATLNGAQREETDIPAELEKFVKKVAVSAYKVTDKDITQLKAAGYSEDDIFEITISAAMGASLGRLELGLQAMEE